ncbi:uncharacterized protein LOC116510123 [Thamnophis elegans]|uniref:uncharacterized protein LOC116510123 n=1 Tax=Thamnophis elegans TaxID=35005 RepID=UPI0013769B18|nr:uncharacterized protein LOC116510123 [Thamnophis elegans]
MLEGNPQSKIFKSIHQIQEIQDALSPINSGECSQTRSPHISGPYRGLLPRANSQAERRFLHFVYAGLHFQYQALPFGLSSAPKVFIKLLSVVAAHLRARPIQIFCYLDDILLLYRSRIQALRDLQDTLQVLEEVEFSISPEKSHFVPTPRLVHLGALIDSSQGKIFLSQECQSSLRELAKEVQRRQRVPLLQLSQLLGKMISCFSIIPWAQLHSRCLQWFLLPFQKTSSSCSLVKVSLTPEILLFLDWWISPAIAQGSLLRDPPRLVVTMDASLTGWGPHLEDQAAQGLWSDSNLSHSMNWLELRAIHLALLYFQTSLQNSHVLVRMDNTMAKAHVNHQGGQEPFLSWSLLFV